MILNKEDVLCRETREPLITVVVPIYNVELYLKQCIDSILNQSYNNLEIILVDDGSTDSCPYICDMYAVKDARVKTLHKENGGLVSARLPILRLPDDRLPNSRLPSMRLPYGRLPHLRLPTN